MCQNDGKEDDHPSFGDKTTEAERKAYYMRDGVTVKAQVCIANMLNIVIYTIVKIHFK